MLQMGFPRALEKISIRSCYRTHMAGYGPRQNQSKLSESTGCEDRLVATVTRSSTAHIDKLQKRGDRKRHLGELGKLKTSLLVIEKLDYKNSEQVRIIFYISSSISLFLHSDLLFLYSCL